MAHLQPSIVAAMCIAPCAEPICKHMKMIVSAQCIVWHNQKSTIGLIEQLWGSLMALPTFSSLIYVKLGRAWEAGRRLGTRLKLSYK